MTVGLPSTLWSRVQLWRHVQFEGAPPEISGKIWIRGGGTVRIGHRVQLDAASAPIELHAGPDAEIVIGDGAYVGGGSSIEAQESVTIGAAARLDAFCKVLDNHFHPVRGDRHAQPASAPVVIGPGASLGRRAIVLPGARVQEGARIAPGAVVRGPPRPAPALDAPAAAHRTASPLRSALALVRGDPLDALRRVSSVLRARWLFSSCERGARIYAGGRVRVVNQGRIAIGERAAFVGGMIPTELISHPGGSLEIGARTVFNYGASIEAFASVRIGSRCLLASQVRICDRGAEGDAPITIGDEVWIAHGVTVCPGVTVGDGSVLAAGSVVTRDVPAGSLAAGNPARCLSLGLAAPGAPHHRGPGP